MVRVSLLVLILLGAATQGIAAELDEVFTKYMEPLHGAVPQSKITVWCPQRKNGSSSHLFINNKLKGIGSLLLWDCLAKMVKLKAPEAVELIKVLDKNEFKEFHSLLRNTDPWLMYRGCAIDETKTQVLLPVFVIPRKLKTRHKARLEPFYFGIDTKKDSISLLPKRTQNKMVKAVAELVKKDIRSRFVETMAKAAGVAGIC